MATAGGDSAQFSRWGSCPGREREGERYFRNFLCDRNGNGYDLSLESQSRDRVFVLIYSCLRGKAKVSKWNSALLQSRVLVFRGGCGIALRRGVYQCVNHAPKAPGCPDSKSSSRLRHWPGITRPPSPLNLRFDHLARGLSISRLSSSLEWLQSVQLTTI